MVSMLALNRQGALSPLFLILLVTLSMGGIGTWGFLRHWRHLVQLQLRLNQCVGTQAQFLRSTLNSLASDNHRIKNLRRAIQLATFQPEALPPLKIALGTLVIHQEWTLSQWKIKQVQWLATRGCGKRGDSAQPLPALMLIRSPPDVTGQQPLKWMGQIPSHLHLQASHPPRHAAAQVFKKEEQGTTSEAGDEEKIGGTEHGKELFSEKSLFSEPDRFSKTALISAEMAEISEEKESDPGEFDQGKWAAAWTAPKKQRWPNFP